MSEAVKPVRRRKHAAKLWLILPVACGLLLLPGCVMLHTGSDEDLTSDQAATATIDPNDPLLDQRQIVLTTDVNELSAKDIIQKLLYLDRESAEPIDLYLDTSGGEVQHCFAIIDTMAAIKAPVNTWAIGNCNSAGALILASGTGRRYALPHAVIAIHGGVKIGRVPREYMGIIDPQMERLWKEHAKLPSDWFPLKGGVLHFLTAERALQYGVIDEIAKPQQKPR